MGVFPYLVRIVTLFQVLWYKKLMADPLSAHWIFAILSHPYKCICLFEFVITVTRINELKNQSLPIFKSVNLSILSQMALIKFSVHFLHLMHDNSLIIWHLIIQYKSSIPFDKANFVASLWMAFILFWLTAIWAICDSTFMTFINCRTPKASMQYEVLPKVAYQTHGILTVHISKLLLLALNASVLPKNTAYSL